MFHKDASVKIETIQLSQTEAQLEKGLTLLLEATILPQEAEDQQLKWSSSNSNVASVEHGLVTAIGAGTAVITAESQDGSNVKASCTVTVTKHIQKFTGTKKYNKTYGDAGFQLDAELTAGDGDISYTSSNPNVVTVSPSGRVVLRGAGEADITISATETEDYQKCDYIVTITVTKAEQVIEGTTEYLKKSSDRDFKLDAELTVGDGTLIYTSSNDIVAVVSDAGQVSLNGAGKAEITITASETDNYKPKQLKIVIKVEGEHKPTVCSHVYQKIITPASVTANGSIVEKCRKCGVEKSRTVIDAVTTAALSKNSYPYNGKVRKPAVAIKDKRGRTLKNGTDYTIILPKGMKNTGRYTVTIILKGNYKGTIKKTFDIVPKGTSISKIIAKKKGFYIKWKKQSSQITGYEIACSTSRNFAKKSTKTIKVKKKKAVSKSISKLRAKKKYYIRIRTYKTVNFNGRSIKLYSAWSKAKSKTTKK